MTVWQEEWTEARAKPILSRAREEAHLLGPHYKAPRAVKAEIWSSPRFRGGLAQLADESGRVLEATEAQAAGYLDEMVAGYGRNQIDVARLLGKLMYRRGYDKRLDFDRQEAGTRLAPARHHATVLLPSHRSNLDAGVMPTAWHELALPPTHTFAGINMAFWPLGPILRRSGSIFIRRDTKGDPVYRYVLREYLGYLVEKRFHLEWYIEGGRSRTGKMLPPRLGLLSYVIDAYWEGRTDDVVLVPASVTYDQLREVEDFAAEAEGAPKEKESIRWLLRSFRIDGRHYGRIYVRFAAPLSLRELLGPPRSSPLDPDERSTALRKIGFEVSRRINEATPVTATALITLSLLGARRTGVSFDHVARSARAHLHDAQRRHLPLTESAANLEHPDGVLAALDALVGKGLVLRFDTPLEPVYRVGPDQHLAAAFYRNSIVHHFLDDSIAQLALAGAFRPESGAGRAEVLERALRLRDLLKFDFFFQERDHFATSIARSLADRDPEWGTRIEAGPDSLTGLLDCFDPLTAHLTLRAFLEAYLVVAVALEQFGDRPATDRPALIAACGEIASRLLLQRHIRCADARSNHLFASGVDLAANRRLLAAGAEPGRHLLAVELTTLLGDLDRVERAAEARCLCSERR